MEALQFVQMLVHHVGTAEGSLHKQLLISMEFVIFRIFWSGAI